jgi:hypothetical protein
MPGESPFVITPAERATLLRGPLGAILMLGGDRTAASLSPVEHPPQPLVEHLLQPRLAAAHGLLVPGAPPGTP